MRRIVALGAVLVGLSACAAPAQPAYVVFFTAFSFSLDPLALGVVSEAAGAAATISGRILVEGYAYPAGSRQQDVVLSNLRAQRVAEALVQDGVPRGRMVVQPRGATPGVPAVESRRVVIELGR
ncbi:MAG: OmpA family protein [Pseudomonadota bacterium]|nr:OmpA family protein [Pseudomonadota bacterium]